MVHPNNKVASGLWKLQNIGSLVQKNYYPNAGARATLGGGNTPSNTNAIEFVTVTTTGNGADFGDLSAAKQAAACVSNGTRGIFAGGYSSSNLNVIEYIHFSHKGNVADFGDLSVARRDTDGFSNDTRGVFSGGNTGSFPAFSASNVIDFVAMSTLGNASDFGDLTVSRADAATFASPLRGYSACGATAPTQSDVIDFIEFSTTGNAVDFGDATETKAYMGGNSSNRKN